MTKIPSLARRLKAESGMSFAVDEGGMCSYSIVYFFRERLGKMRIKASQINKTVTIIGVFSSLLNGCSFESPNDTKLYSQCGPTFDAVDVESYGGSADVSKEDMEKWQSPVGYAAEIGCTGTLIAESLFLSAGHCEYSTGKSVLFGYQKDSSGAITQGVPFTITAIVEQEYSRFHAGQPTWDYAILRLDGDPSRRFGIAKMRASDPGESENLLIIQHPLGGAKVVAFGAFAGIIEGTNHFLHTVDALEGSSGSGLLAKDGALIGIHTNGGCKKTDPVLGNKAIRLSMLASYSATIRAIISSYGNGGNP